MIPEDFSKALLRSASNDTPLPNAKARAMSHVEHALTATTAVAAGSSAAVVATTMTMTTKIAIAAALVVGGLGGGYELGRASRPIDPVAQPAASAKEAAPRGIAPEPVGPVFQTPSARMKDAPVADVDVCRAMPEVVPQKCSTPKGRSVTFELKSSCSEAAVDVFWVDESCHEIFNGMVQPGERYFKDSYDTYAFRLRDHTTHRLLKELVPVQVAGAPDRATYWKGPPTELSFVIHETDKPLPEAPPPDCARGGGRSANIHLRNERKDGPIVVTEVTPACKESSEPPLVLKAGGKQDWRTSEGHAYRVRDVTGALLMDILPTSLDTTTYLTVP